ncbi:MAG TPA: transposase [Streptomyces sp.]|uniref:transposase n=1 Tax=Streptomyces sp. TaxID=1931 RepID=UPI002C76AF0F|nr:transposase [Streptomyces sp.]HWU08404.1 transposase [Streptomyces sp.]
MAGQAPRSVDHPGPGRRPTRPAHLRHGPEKALDTVIAWLSLRYNSGAVEGENSKIKMLKRQMFGLANFDLLHKRALLTTRDHS